MAKQLLGKEVNEALVANLQARTAALREKGVAPCLGIIRVGARPDDLSYEKGAIKKGETVGIAVKVDDEWHVVHAVPDEPDFEGDFDRVKCEPIERFYDEFRAGNGAVYRPNVSNETIAVAVRNALRLSAEQRPFDHDYNLGDTTALYCTELVEYVFGLGGVSMSEGRQTYVNFPSMTGDYIMPSDLTKNNKLNPIYSF